MDSPTLPVLWHHKYSPFQPNALVPFSPAHEVWIARLTRLLQLPCNVLVVGRAGSGKTVCVREALRRAYQCKPGPWFLGHWSSAASTQDEAPVPGLTMVQTATGAEMSIDVRNHGDATGDNRRSTALSQAVTSVLNEMASGTLLPQPRTEASALLPRTVLVRHFDRLSRSVLAALRQPLERDLGRRRVVAMVTQPDAMSDAILSRFAVLAFPTVEPDTAKAVFDVIVAKESVPATIALAMRTELDSLTALAEDQHVGTWSDVKHWMIRLQLAHAVRQVDALVVGAGQASVVTRPQWMTQWYELLDQVINAGMAGKDEDWGSWCKVVSGLLAYGITASTLLLCGVEYLAAGLRQNTASIGILLSVYRATDAAMQADLGRSSVEEALAHISVWIFDIIDAAIAWIGQQAARPAAQAKSKPLGKKK